MKTVAIKRIKYSPINNPHLPNERLCLLKHASMAKRRHPEMNNEYWSLKGRAKFDNKATLKITNGIKPRMTLIHPAY